MTIDEFYEKAKQGGYDFERLGSPKSVVEKDNALFLDPLAWQAVGKVERWDSRMDKWMCECDMTIWYSYKFCPKCGNALVKTESWTNHWKKSMHRMIDALCEGKTINEFLETL